MQGFKLDMSGYIIRMKDSIEFRPLFRTYRRVDQDMILT